jgi:hypothetical protein
MEHTTQNIFPEKSSNIIPIIKKKNNQNNCINNISASSNQMNYVMENLFDPSKSSPPNEFIEKLHMRMNKYYVSIIPNRDIQ